MSHPTTIAQAIVDTVVARLALFFLASAGSDMTAARQAAQQMLAAHNPETPDELTLAAEIISLQFHTLEALSAASDPDLSLHKVLRLRGNAVSLSRESHKARRKLDQLQRARRTDTAAQLTEAPPGQPAPQPETTPTGSVPELMEAARQVMQTVNKTNVQKWSQSYQKRQTAKRIAENLRRRQAEHTSLPTQPDAATAA